MARTAKISVMLSDAIKADLAVISESYGMSESAMIAFIVGQWVTSNRVVMAQVKEFLPNLTKSVSQDFSAGVEADRP